MKYYCIKQHDITNCGAACLATICKQNGYKIGITTRPEDSKRRPSASFYAKRALFIKKKRSSSIGC